MKLNTQWYKRLTAALVLSTTGDVVAHEPTCARPTVPSLEAQYTEGVAAALNRQAIAYTACTAQIVAENNRLVAEYNAFQAEVHAFNAAMASAGTQAMSAQEQHASGAQSVARPANNLVTPAAHSLPSECLNTFLIDGMRGYYSAAAFDESRTIAAAGSKATSSDPQSVILVLASAEKIEGVDRYTVALQIPKVRLQVGTIPFQDDSNVLGLEAGAVGILSYSVGASKQGSPVLDQFRTNRDHGRNRMVGKLMIERVAPKLEGSFEFEAFGDGYPSLNNFKTDVRKGRFCVDP